jgi:protein SCO1/2
MSEDAARAARPRLGFALAGSLGIAFLLLGLAWGARARPAPVPVLGEVPTFRFTNQDGAPFGSRELLGKPFVVGFVFTRCEGICPRLTDRMAALQRSFGAPGARVHFVSISVDPGFDTPAELRAYATAHHANLSGWDFLTGDSRAVEDAVVKGFHIALSREDSKDPKSILHGGQLVLVDGRGQIRGYYDSADDGAMAQLERDARRMVRP